MEIILSGSNLVNMSHPADWGSNGWILLNLMSNEGENIYRIKDNGDSLSQLTFTRMNFNPLWSPSGGSFGYQYQPGGAYPIIMDLSTNETDTVAGFFNGGCWYAPNTLATLSSGVWLWQIGSEPYKVCDYPTDLYDFAGPSGIAVLADHTTAVWMHTGGLYRTDLSDGGTTQLCTTCNSRYFVGLDHSSQTNKLLTMRITRTPISEFNLRIETEIVLMNPDGSGQEILQLPFPE